jgi:hypothetical protein
MKFVIDALDQVPEPLRGEYESRNGKFYLKTEGDYLPLVEANQKLTEFRDNNRALNGTVSELQGKLKSFEGIDPKEFSTLKERVAEFEKTGAKKGDDVVEMIKAAVKAAVDPLNQKLAEREKAEADARQKLEVTTLENNIRDIGVKLGVDERALPDYINRAKTVFRLNEGKLVARNGDQPIFSKTRPAEELGLEEWTETVARQDAPFLFKPSRGGGASNSPGGFTGQRQVISNDPLEFGRNLEKIAKGEVVVQG